MKQAITSLRFFGVFPTDPHTKLTAHMSGSASSSWIALSVRGAALISSAAAATAIIPLLL